MSPQTAEVTTSNRGVPSENTPTCELVSTRSLAELEAVIERGLATFIEVGTALLEIRDGRLYKPEFATFEDYCRERWKWGRNYANKQIAAAQVVRNLGTNVPKPQTEAQARELTRLTPEQLRHVAESVDFAKATAADVREQVQLTVRETAPAKTITPRTVSEVILTEPAPSPKGDIFSVPEAREKIKTTIQFVKSCPDDDEREKLARRLYKAVETELEYTPDDRRSKADRWQGAVEELKQLQSEYEQRLDNLPENIKYGTLAEKLQAVVDIDLSELEEADLP